jgi:hypothetical protein
MKDTKREQLVMLIIATFFTGFMIFFVKDSGAASVMGTTFTGIVGVFIGLDIVVMIKKTSSLPEGLYKKINKHRYITALVIFSLLMIETFIISGTGRNCDSLYMSFGMGFLVVIGGLIAGIEGNKIVTGEGARSKTITPDTIQAQSVNGNDNTVAGGDIIK